MIRVVVFLFLVLHRSVRALCCVFLLNETATTEIYTLTHSVPTRRASDLRVHVVESAQDVDLVTRNSELFLGLSQGGIERSGIPFVCRTTRSEEHTSELQSLMRISYAVFCLKKQPKQITPIETCCVGTVYNTLNIVQLA